MAYRTILLYLDNEAEAPALIKLASTVASQHNAHLIGLFVIHPLEMYVGLASASIVTSEVSNMFAKEQIDRMKRLHELFDNETKNQDYIAEWRFIDERISTVSDTLLMEASTVDLLIIGHRKGSREGHEIVNDAMLSSPVPVLVIPDDFDGKSFGQNILIAWDGGTRVARAVTGAKPVLQAAESVVIHHVRTSMDKDIAMDSNMQELAENLSRHNIKSELSQSTSERKEIGNTIAGVIRDHGVDCVVMGAYGHSNIRNLILGSTTDYALKNIKVPLLMWH